MKAMVYTEYGPPEVVRLAEVETPAPGDKEILVKVHATTVNRTDCGFRKPEYPVIIRLVNGLFKPGKTILGSELAGEVETVGKDVKSFKKGDQVFGLTGDSFGAHAEYVCLPENAAIAAKPSTMSYDEAAAVCEGLMIGFSYLRTIDLHNGTTVLINGASGSIGSACLQLAKYYGATVTAVCSPRSIEVIKSLGADEVIDYTKEDFTQSKLTYDVIVDAVGKSSFFRCRKLLKEDGVFFSSDLGFLAQNPFLALWTTVFARQKVKFPLPKVDKKDMLFFKELLETGKYRAVIDRRYPLEDIVEAYKYVETEQKTGNVVITVEHEHHS